MTRTTRFACLPLVLVLSLFAIDATSAPLEAQATSASVDTVFVSQKSPVTAGLLEWIVPTAGYAYAGNWKRGLIPAAVRVTGVVVFLSNFEGDAILSTRRTACDGTCTAGLVIGAAASLYAILDAPAEARRYNERNGIAASIRVTPAFGPNGVGLGVRIPLGN